MADASQSTFSPVVVLPTYNNAKTLAAALSGVATRGLPIILVNDGCTDSTPAVIAQWQAENPGNTLVVVTHEQNRGKAAALRTGFEAAQPRGFTHAVTIDTDGQLDPADIPAMLEISKRSPHAYVIGTRDENASDYPSRSRLGRQISNFCVKLESGRRVRDSQCGLRVYPLEMVRTVRCAADRFGFETEMITRAAWAGWHLAESPVKCVYLAPGQRVSHFRPWVDSLRAIAMHFRLVGRALMPWPHKRTRPASPTDLPLRKTSWRVWLRWLHPMKLWKQLRHSRIDRTSLASGLAAGVFIGNLPIYGFQTLLGLYTARKLHLHPIAVIAGTSVSTPPLGPILIAAAIYVGHFILHGAWPVLKEIPKTEAALRLVLPDLLVSWAVGGMLVGAVMAILTFFTTVVCFRFFAGPEKKLAAEPVDAQRSPIRA